MENIQIAAVFEEIADLLALLDDNPFRIRSYRNAARMIRNLNERLETMVEAGRDVSEIPNIGAAISAKIHEILAHGTCKYLEDLRQALPRGIQEIMHIPGVGPRKAMQIYQELKVESLEELEQACRAHRVRALAGMGEKSESNILRGLQTVKQTSDRLLYRDAADHLQALAAHLDGLSPIERWEVAGSFRRSQATIGDLDVLLQSGDRPATTDAILRYAAIREVIGRGDERVSVRLEGGLQVDFRYVDRAAFGAAWMYFTGSKAHNIKIRRIARASRWKLNEYGLFDGDRRLAGSEEKDVYRRLGMDWVPPELREDGGEVEAALAGDLPVLVTRDDIRGDFQCHTTASDGTHDIAAMAAAAREYGFSFLAITDHSRRVTMANGLDDARAREHAAAIRAVDAGMKQFWLLAGIEVDILKNGDLDLERETLAGMDWVVAGVHYDRAMSRRAMTDRIVTALRSGVVHCLAHPLGRIIGRREPIAVDIDRIIEACVEHDVCLEINGQPDRLDLPDTLCRYARDRGVRFALSTDAHATNGFRNMALATNVARRGWLCKQDIRNTLTITQLKRACARHPGGSGRSKGLIDGGER